MFNIFFKIKNKLWKMWIKIKYGKDFFNNYRKLVENTKTLEKLKRGDKIFYV